MNVLGRMIEAVKPGGLILDLQVIRPDPQVVLNGHVVAEIDGEQLFQWADAATAAIDARIDAGDLVEEVDDDHEVCKHYADGAELVEDVAGSKRRLPGRRRAARGRHRRACRHARALPTTKTARRGTCTRLGLECLLEGSGRFVGLAGKQQRLGEVGGRSTPLSSAHYLRLVSPAAGERPRLPSPTHDEVTPGTQPRTSSGPARAAGRRPIVGMLCCLS